MTSITYIDLFAGIGGFRLGVNGSGNCVFSSEVNSYARQVYKANFKETPEGDICKIAASHIPKHQLLCAGFPCQPFSISGKQKGFDDTRGTLFFEIARIVAFHQPAMLLLENVKNILTHNNGKTLSTILKTLDELGYQVFYHLLNASEFGLPQKRERVFFAAFRKDMKVTDFVFPKPGKQLVSLLDNLLPDTETRYWVINRPDIRFNGNQTQTIKANKPLRVGTVSKGGQGERIYHELGHAVTLSALGGGIGSKTGLYLVNGKVRKLSPRECARIQGFPDDFTIDANPNQAFQQFGNAVPVNVVKEVTNKMMEKLINLIFL